MKFDMVIVPASVETTFISISLCCDYVGTPSFVIFAKDVLNSVYFPAFSALDFIHREI
jgi:hypothetical protein